MKVVRVLIVDDESQTADTLSKIISLMLDWPLETEVCRTGEAAFEYLDLKPFDVLITDGQLPDMSGLALTLQAHKRFPDMKIVYMTATPVAEIEEKVRMVADIFIKKPFPASMLAAQLQGLLQEKVSVG